MRLNKHHFHKYQQHFHFLTLSSGNLLISVAILSCLIANGITKTNAVPTDSTDGTARTQLLQRALRDVAAIAASFMQDDVTKDATSVAVPAVAALTSDEASSSVQPQGQCLLDGALVAETSVLCKKQVGCRAIQKTGYCCPDYKCDCEKDGKTYLNGDKLVDPETPCTVCYCQGGEILCSPVSCFHRDDCTPKYIAGRCCPEYDNCPVSSPEPNTTTNKTISETLSSPTTLKPEVPAAALNPKITIKEITKPTEIRITDDNKGIPIHQMLKPSTTEPTTTSTTTTTSASATTSPAIEANDMSTTKATSTHESFGTDTNHNANNSYKPAGGINNESLKLSASVAYSSTEHPQHAMITSGIAQQMHEIVMVDNRNGGEKPFAAFGTQGLQRVESEGASDPNSKVNIKREFLDTTEGVPTVSTPDSTSDEYGSAELIYSQALGVTNGHASNFQHSSAEATEPDTAGSDNIYHIIMTTDGPRVASSTENYLALKGSIATEGLPSSFEPDLKAEFNAIPAAAEQQKSSSTESPLNEGTSTNNLLDISTEGIKTSTPLTFTSTPKHSPLQPSTEGAHHQHHHHLAEDEDTAIPIEANPAYPSLPEDDFSLRDVNFPLGEGDELVDEPRSNGGGSSYDALKSTKQLDDVFINMSGSGSGDNDVVMEPSTESSGELMSSSSIIALMYSAEDASEETAVYNAPGLQLISTVKESENETGSGESQEMDLGMLYMGSGSGGGSSEFNENTKISKKREPTTPRPTRRPTEVLDIDDIGAFNETISPADDPKLDVESLKLNEEQDEVNLNSDAATRGNILSVKTHPLQDKTIESQLGVVGVADNQLVGERVQRLFLQVY